MRKYVNEQIMLNTRTWTYIANNLICQGLLKVWIQKAQLRGSLNLKLWKNFVIVNNMCCLAVMAVKLKEHLQIHVVHEYFSNYLQPSLIGSDGIFADKAKNMCFDWHLVKFILTILKRNILPLKLWAMSWAMSMLMLRYIWRRNCQLFHLKETCLKNFRIFCLPLTEAAVQICST